MDALLLDLRYAFRDLTRRPGFALTAIASLALGIAATTAIFSMVNGVFFKRVSGVTRTDRLVQLTRHVVGEGGDMSLPVVRHLKEQAALVEDIAGYAIVPASVVVGDEPIVRGGLAVTADYFTLLGVSAGRGRIFTPDEATYPSVTPVVVISHDLWARGFGAGESLIGRSIRVNGFPVEVIGILPPGFSGHQTGLLFDVFLPLGLAVPGLPTPPSLDDPRGGELEVIARLPRGLSHAAAASALSTTAGRFISQEAAGADSRGYTIRVDSWGPLPGTVRGSAAAFFSLLSALVALALTMSCTNVTSMLLARAAERRREIAVRQALGASPSRLRRQVVTEVLVLFALAGLTGGALAVWTMDLLSTFSLRLPLPGRIGFDFGLDWRVFAFSVLITFGVGLLVGLISTARAGRSMPSIALKDGAATGSRERARVRSMLVGLQVAVTTLLLVAGGLIARSVTNLEQFDPGWIVDGVQIVDLDLELRGADAAAGRAFYAALVDRTRAIPGVEAAALAAKLPLAGCSSFGSVNPAGATIPPPGRGYAACLNRVTPGYFRSLGLPILRGREFGQADDERALRVAVINDTMAERLWPGLDPVGRDFIAGVGVSGRSFRIVGVVASAKYHQLDEEPRGFYYVPAAQWHNAQMVLHVRTAPGLAPTVSAALPPTIRALDPYLPFSGPRTMTEALDLFFLPQRIAAWVAGAMGMFALLLAAVGVYGVTAVAISGRTREMGVRMALGATWADITRLVMRQSAVAPSVGIMVGLVLGAAFAQMARTILSGVNTADPIALAVVPLVVGASTAAAILIPAQRMLRGDPVAALMRE